MPRPMWATNRNLMETFFSFAIFVLSFWWCFGLEMALIVTLVVSCHEAGHLFAIHRFRLKLQKVFFLPFFGAKSQIDKNERVSDAAEGWNAIMGPVFGAILAFLAFVIWRFTGQKLFAITCLVAALASLLTFVPVFPVDGGRVIRVCTHALSAGVGLLVFVLITAACAVPLVVFSVRLIRTGLRALNLASSSFAALVGILFILICMAFFAYKEIRQRLMLIRSELTLKEEKRAVFRGVGFWGPRQEEFYDSEMWVRKMRNKNMKPKEALALLAVYLLTAMMLVLMLIMVFKPGFSALLLAAKI